MEKWEFEAIGTHWRIDIDEKVNKERVIKVKSEISKRIEEFEKTYSRFRDDSTVSKIAKKQGVYELPEDSLKIFDVYKKLYILSEGELTPLVGGALVDAGYDKQYSLAPKIMESVPAWEESIDFQDRRLVVKKPSRLDFGAAGKGYLIDLVFEIIRENGINNLGVEAGGDMRFGGIKTYQIGLENPDNFSEVIGVVEINNQSICGSAGNRRKWSKFNHIISPSRLKSPTDYKAVWVMSKETIVADGLTTAIYFCEIEKLQKMFEFEYLAIKDNNRVVKSSGFGAKLYI